MEQCAIGKGTCAILPYVALCNVCVSREWTPCPKCFFPDSTGLLKGKHSCEESRRIWESGEE